MDTQVLQTAFARMGARVLVRESIPSERARVDIKHDRRGAYFDLLAGERTRVVVPEVRSDMKHLLLLVDDGESKHKFLCGHDERDWFAAAVPEQRGVSNVRTAIEALKPLEVRREALRRGVGPAEFARRHTAAYTRQGEWFFVPREGLRVDPCRVRGKEPLRRSARGKPHLAEFAFREGGEVIFVSTLWPRGVSAARYHELMRTRESARKQRWTSAVRDPVLYVKGRVSHPDHATITLDCWHRVFMNTENQAASMRHLAFID